MNPAIRLSYHGRHLPLNAALPVRSPFENSSNLLTQRLCNFLAGGMVLVTLPAMGVVFHLDGGWKGVVGVAFFGTGAALSAFALRRQLVGRLPLAVIFFSLVIGYMVKYVDRGLAISSGDAFSEEYVAIPQAVRLHAYDKEHLQKGFLLAATGMLAFGVCINVMPSSRILVSSIPVQTARVNGALRSLLLASIVAASVLSALAAFFGIGTMHMQQNVLPFKLSGIINYARSSLPLCFFLIFILASQARARALTWAAGGCVVAYAILISASTGSRGALFVPLVMLAIYGTIYSKVSRPAVMILAVLMVLYSVFRPVLSQYRDYMVEAGAIPTPALAVKLLGASIGDVVGTSKLSDIWQLMFSVVDRVQGLDGLLFLSLEQPRYDPVLAFRVFANDFQLSRYMTDDVMEFSIGEGRTHASAPGMLGAFYFLGGTPGIIAGLLGYASVLQYAYRYIMQRPLWVQPVALCYICYSSMQMFSEGNLNVIIKDQAFAFVFFASLEWYCRRNLGPRVIRTMPVDAAVKQNLI